MAKDSNPYRGAGYGENFWGSTSGTRAGDEPYHGGPPTRDSRTGDEGYWDGPSSSFGTKVTGAQRPKRR